MIVLIVESVPPGLRGELSKWLLEPQAGVFIGNVSGAVRDLLWEKACTEAGVGNCTLIQPAANEQGYVIRTWGETRRQIEEWEGLYLVRRPIAAEGKPLFDETPDDWNDYLHPRVWAKTARGVKLAPGEPEYHPLAGHMIDTAMVALEMWRTVLPAELKARVGQALHISDPDECGRWVAFFIGLHDLGKASPAFQHKWAEGWKRLIDLGFLPARHTHSCSHFAMTTYRLTGLLEELGFDYDFADVIATVVGAHHGTFPASSELLVAKYVAGGERWQKAQSELLRLLAHALQLDRSERPSGDLRCQNGFLMVLAGLCSVCDWIASNHDCFSYAGDQIRIPDYLEHSRGQAHQALLQLGWLDRPKVMQVQDFNELFEHIPNSLQKQVLEIAEDLDGPSLVLLEYPMGGGKTEAALWLADYLACTAGQTGLYFALPTMATSNQMFGRVRKYVSNRFPDSAINMMLLHGHASLNAEFEILRQRGAAFDRLQVDEDRTASTHAAEWFTYRKRGLLAPYGIGTIDQALLAVLQTPHFFVRLLGLSGKVLILDEVHAYDSYMQSLLAQLLSWMAACHTSVVLLSATLPAHTRQALLDAYSHGLGQSVPVSSAASPPYPRLSYISRSGASSRHIEGAPSRTVQLEGIQLADPECLEMTTSTLSGNWMLELQRMLQAGGCAAVIMNTVGRAQYAYQQLKQYFPDEELILLHGRFPFDMRAERELAVLDLFGPPGQASRPERAVVISTQILEQSLDLDFDLMVTDLAPIDLILQRSGRLWRHQRSRPEGLEGPRLWLLMPSTDDQGVPQFDSGSAFVYDEHTLLRTWLTVKDRQTLRIPADMDVLIEAVYRPEEAPDDMAAPLQAYWQQTSRRLHEQIDKEKHAAIDRHIPPIDEELITMPMKELTEDGEELHPAYQAMTRLGGISVTVVCLYREGDSLFTVGPERQQIVLRRPNPAETRALLGCSLRMSFAPDLVKRLLELAPPPEWGDSAHLRRCRLLTFDAEGNCLLPDMPLRLDPELGLYRIQEGREEK